MKGHQCPWGIPLPTSSIFHPSKCLLGIHSARLCFWDKLGDTGMEQSCILVQSLTRQPLAEILSFVTPKYSQTLNKPCHHVRWPYSPPAPQPSGSHPAHIQNPGSTHDCGLDFHSQNKDRFLQVSVTKPILRTIDQSSVTLANLVLKFLLSYKHCSKPLTKVNGFAVHGNQDVMMKPMLQMEKWRLQSHATSDHAV